MSEADRILDVLEQAHPLDRIARAGYVLRGVPEPESVAAHSYSVSLLALLFLEQYPGAWDREQVLAMALVHDLAEARLMDIPVPAAEAHLGEAKRDAETAIVNDLLAGFPPRLAALHDAYQRAATPEARLVRGLDKAQMMIKVWCYERERRGRLDEFWSHARNFDDFGIPQVGALFDALCARSGHPRPGRQQ